MTTITNLKYLLLKSEETQNTIANACGMHASQLSQYAKGHQAIPIKHLRALCRYFKVSQQDLLGKREL